MSAPLIRVRGLVRDYLLPRRRLLAPAPRLRAVDGVDLETTAGVSVGIVGESGCGKSTLARAVMALEPPTAGTVELMGTDLFALPPARLRAMRRHMQMVFQDPYGSLDPRHPVRRIVAEPLDVLEPDLDRAQRRERIADALGTVGLKAADGDKFPHEFSGGQRQRIAIARALITRPELIVADEPVSALDVSVQAQVLNLMLDLERDQGVTYLFISHDLGVVRHVTRRVAVMYLGRVVEEGPTPAVFAAPAHPYTRALLDAMPRPDPARFGHRAGLRGEAILPTTDGEPSACPFAPRCPMAEARCREEAPDLRELAGDRRVACHLA